MLYTPAVRSSRGEPSDARQLSAWLRGSPLVSKKIFQSCIVEHRVRQKPLQLRVLVFKRLQALGFEYVQATEFSLQL
ncbi:Hypothetical protein AT6N2_L1253 [Agrobacterium tumefaciens]|nr:Hypothetical protein AT6N2_L1253 [Agrobacterium tumefaciens]